METPEDSPPAATTASLTFPILDPLWLLNYCIPQKLYKTKFTN